MFAKTETMKLELMLDVPVMAYTPSRLQNSQVVCPQNTTSNRQIICTALGSMLKWFSRGKTNIAWHSTCTLCCATWHENQWLNKRCHICCRHLLPMWWKSTSLSCWQSPNTSRRCSGDLQDPQVHRLPAYFPHWHKGTPGNLRVPLRKWGNWGSLLSEDLGPTIAQEQVSSTVLHHKEWS